MQGLVKISHFSKGPMKTLPIRLIFFVIFLIPSCSNIGGDSNCIKGDCVNGQGTYKSSWRKYAGEWKDGLQVEN